MPIINGIRGVVIYDPASGTAVQIPNVVANTFDFSQSPLDLGERYTTGPVPDQGHVSVCGFQFLDTTGAINNQLVAWRAARTRVSMVALGHSVNVQWYEADHFTIKRVNLSGMAQGRGDRYQFDILRNGHGHHAIYQQTNLIGHINGRGVTSWRDDPAAAGKADGYTSTGAGTLAWVSLTTSQSVTHNAPDHGIYFDVVLPVRMEGFTFTLSSDIVETHTDNSLATVRLEGKNFAGTNVVTAETDSATGRASVSISTASNTLYTLRVMPLLTPTGVTTSDDVVGGFPVLRVDGQTTFIDN